MSELLANPQYSKQVQDALLRWIASQRFESTTIVGLLVLLRTSIRGGDSYIPSLSIVQKCVARPSILSWMLISELFGACLDHKGSLVHSEQAPPTFSPDPLFEKYVKNYLPPIYEMWVEEIEERLITFRRQWAYEWSVLRKNSVIEPSDRTLQFWLGRDYDEERYFGADMPMSELYRSAYLRALAWLVTSDRLDLREAIRIASKVCPIDLELWKLDPRPRPEWWPWVEESEGAIDVVPAEIWSKVAGLWEEQQNESHEWVLTQATGYVHRGSVIYDLEIHGIFQKYFGPDDPNLQDISRWYREQSRLFARFDSPLRFAGTIDSRSIVSGNKRSGGWDVIPAAARVVQTDSSRWQFWRIYQGVWLPTPFFQAESVRFKVSDNAVRVLAESQLIAKWNDWTCGLSEKWGPYVPPPAGQHLFMKRSEVQAFSEGNDAVFCWVCKLTGYQRQDKHRPYETFSDFREFGSTRVVRG